MFKCYRYIVTTILGVGLLFLLRASASALPVYSRQYNVGCQMCHTVAPRLNKFGYAFQANFFNWPTRNGKPKRDPTEYLPVTTLTTFSYQNDITGRQETANLRTFELFLSSGFGSKETPPGRSGGYYVDVLAGASPDSGTPGELGDAYIALPVAGKRGQLAVLLGQTSAIRYQYNPNNSLTDQIPYALAEGVGDFALASSAPSVRLEYFDNRGKMSADGNYVTLALPFQGHLALTRDNDVHAEDGFFGHYFHRWGYSTLGAMVYHHGSNNLEGFVGTYGLRKNLNLSAFATLAHSPGYNTSHLALEAEYLSSHNLAINGRCELIGGDRSEVATVGAITYYPFRTQYVRVTAEARERRTDRAVNLFFRVQY